MDTELLDRARRGLLNGTLPIDDATATGGKGSGSTCAVCNQPIKPETVQIDLESKATDARIPVHANCHIA